MQVVLPGYNLYDGFFGGPWIVLQHFESFLRSPLFPEPDAQHADTASTTTFSKPTFMTWPVLTGGTQIGQGSL